ncbi:MerR family transcriptional regulator [bacterium]|nr:MerR family transcriptional regulator [bacterium]
MSKETKTEGTRIVQAAQELNVTSVTVRRYINEFNIETATDRNGVKVLSEVAMQELRELRRLKEEGLTNPQVLEEIERQRANSKKTHATEAKVTSRTKESFEASEVEEKSEMDAEKKSHTEFNSELTGKHPSVRAESMSNESEEKATSRTRSRNRDRRRERRYGGDKQKNVIQHPLAQQVFEKMARKEPYQRPANYIPKPKPVQNSQSAAQPVVSGITTKVRSYGKAIDETRRVSSSLKRRLERPDLPVGERRWLEQIYAYQLILHQGWRHLADYRAATKRQKEE